MRWMVENGPRDYDLVSTDGSALHTTASMRGHIRCPKGRRSAEQPYGATVRKTQDELLAPRRTTVHARAWMRREPNHLDLHGCARLLVPCIWFLACMCTLRACVRACKCVRASACVHICEEEETGVCACVCVYTRPHPHTHPHRGHVRAPAPASGQSATGLTATGEGCRGGVGGRWSRSLKPASK